MWTQAGQYQGIRVLPWAARTITVCSSRQERRNSSGNLAIAPAQPTDTLFRVVAGPGTKAQTHLHMTPTSVSTCLCVPRRCLPYHETDSLLSLQIQHTLL